MNQFVVNRMAKNIYRSNCHYGGIDCMLTTFYVPSHHKNFIHNFSSPLPLPTEPTPRFVIRPRPGAGGGGLGQADYVDEDTTGLGQQLPDYPK